MSYSYFHPYLKENLSLATDLVYYFYMNSTYLYEG